MPGMHLDDLDGLPTVDEVRLSPDGRLVAATVRTADLAGNAYRSEVWLGPVDASSPLRPLTAGRRRDGRPRFSPDGGLLAFTSHRDDGDGACTIHVLPVDGPGEVRTVATWPREVDDLAWSPDGRTLAFGARRPDEQRDGKDWRDQPPRRLTTLHTRLDDVGWTITCPRQLHVVPADGSRPPRTATDGGAPDWLGLGWSPDGTALVAAAARHDGWDLDQVRDLWALPLDGGAPRRLTAGDRAHALPAWSPDGRHVACALDSLPDRHEGRRVAVVDVATGERVELVDGSRGPWATSAARPPAWRPDGTVLTTLEDRGAVHLVALAADGAAPPTTVLGGARQVVAFDAAADVVAAVVTEPTVPYRLVVVAADGEERSLATWGDHLTPRLVEPVRFTAPSTGGAEVDCWYLPPVGVADGEPHPVLLDVHGGPFTQYGDRFFDEWQLQAGAGFGVLACNPRGSSGRGDGWGQAVAWPDHPVHPGSGWGGVDVDDVLACLDEALRRFPALDRDRVGVLGGSYGGYMTTWLVGRTDRFAAACSERAANDLWTLEAGSSDIATVFRSYTGARWFDDPERYRSRSPTTYAQRITTPMLLIHNEGDLRCTVDQADALFVTLRALGRRVEYLRFPGGSHELSRSGPPAQRRWRAEAILEWFDRWLRPAPGGPA